MSDAEILNLAPMRSPLRRLTGVEIVGTGSFVPDNVITNEALASLGCDADWIIQRTGIRERRHAPPDMSTSDMATIAAERCIQAAGVDRCIDHRRDVLVGHSRPEVVAAEPDRRHGQPGRTELGVDH